MSASMLRSFRRYSYRMYVFHVTLEGMLDLHLRAALRAWSGWHLLAVVGTSLILAV